MAIPGSCFSDAHKLAHTSDVWCSHIFLCFFFFSFYSSPCPSIGGPYRLLRAFGSFFLSLPIVVLTTLDLKWLFPCWKMETPFFHSFCLFSRIDTFPVLVLPQGYSEVPEFGFQADKWRHKEPWKMQEQQEKKGSWRYIWGYLVRRDTRLGGLLNTISSCDKAWELRYIANCTGNNVHCRRAGQNDFQSSLPNQFYDSMPLWFLLTSLLLLVFNMTGKGLASSYP